MGNYIFVGPFLIFVLAAVYIVVMRRRNSSQHTNRLSGGAPDHNTPWWMFGAPGMMDGTQQHIIDQQMHQPPAGDVGHGHHHGGMDCGHTHHDAGGSCGGHDAGGCGGGGTD